MQEYLPYIFTIVSAVGGAYLTVRVTMAEMKRDIKYIEEKIDTEIETKKGNDTEIAQFCQVNYGVNFPIAKKGVVVKNADQQAVYQWLTDSKENGWNNHQGHGHDL
jgi:glutathione peroxidase